ncbi:MAG: AbrB/MazE/SpoVT family DNA-binding domain-containing protein [Spirochaetales bacterium]|nr:AbrB/MazE/SpoVT family DNA-binding domain-containing protein [Spirochaetales bacterium]
MRVTSKGQVTIPLALREKYGINENVEVEFFDDKGKIYIEIIKNPENKQNRFEKFRGIATVKMSTDDIMALTRGER